MVTPLRFGKASPSGDIDRVVRDLCPRALAFSQIAQATHSTEITFELTMLFREEVPIP